MSISHQAEALFFTAKTPVPVGGVCITMFHPDGLPSRWSKKKTALSAVLPSRRPGTTACHPCASCPSWMYE